MSSLVSNLKLGDIRYIEDLVISAKMYLKKNLSDMDIITKINGICSRYLKYMDPKLTMFKGMWFQIGDIDSQKETDEYIQSEVKLMEETCREIIDEYTPILEGIKEKVLRDFIKSCQAAESM